MAGSFVKILNPGYSALYTRDLPVLTSTFIEDSASMNVFDPDSNHPLQEGEWLTNAAGGKFARGGTSVAASSDVHNALTAAGAVLTIVDAAVNLAETRPCHMYFQERGRYDAQLTRKAHCIIGPLGYEYRTKMIVCASNDPIGDKVFVYTCIDSSSRVVQALVSATAATAASAAPAPASGDWFAGTITQVHGTNDATILFQPGFLA